MNVFRLDSSRDTILVIGDISAWHNDNLQLPLSQSLRYGSYGELDDELMSWVRPDIVVAPLISTQFDAFDVLIKLSEFGYLGRLLVVSKPIPNVDLVQEEMNRCAPGIELY